MSSLFISYSRKDIEIARKLTQSIEGQGLDFWIDWEGIPPTVDWWREIERGIEGADIFLFLISPDSAKSKVCKQEIEHAAKNGKRLIPVVVRDIKADDSPAELKSLNWIFIRENDDFDINLGKLITAIKTDYEWVQAHSQLQVKALEWERNNHENGFLLHGKELQDAEIQLVANSSKQPHPTDLQREYVLKSRQITDKQRRTTTSVAVAGLIIVAALAMYGLVQAGIARNAQATAEANAAEAQTAQAIAENKENARATAQAQSEERASIAISRQLVANSILNRDESQLSLLLAIEAFDAVSDFTRSERLQPEQALRDALSQIGGLPIIGIPIIASQHSFSLDSRWLATGGWKTSVFLVDMNNPSAAPVILREPERDVTNVALSPDGRWLAIGSADGTARLWDTQDLSTERKIMRGHEDSNVRLAFSPDGNWLATWGWNDDNVNLWDMQNLGTEPSVLRGHADPFSDAFSPDAHWFVTVSSDNTGRLWNMQDRSDEPIALTGYKT
jgi:hypothetical protein